MEDFVGLFEGRDWIEPEMLGKNSHKYVGINDDWSRDDWLKLVEVAKHLKKKYKAGQLFDTILKNKTLFMLFFNDSLRTRNSFEAGMTYMGGHAHFLDPKAIYKPALPGEDVPYKTERIADVARVLSEMGHAIAIRIYGGAVDWQYAKGHKVNLEFAKWANIPLINMEDDIFHPCQALADWQAIDEHLHGRYEKKKYVMSYAFSGGLKPLAVPTSCVLSAAMMGMDVVFARPDGFELEDSIIARCKEYTDMFGGSFEETNNMDEAFEGADVVYPKAWTPRDALIGPWNNRTQPDIDLANKLSFDNKHWLCDQRKLDRCNKNVKYMHCLPADRGQEVTDDVIDGPNSIVFDEAGNRLHAQNALMATIMGSRKLD